MSLDKALTRTKPIGDDGFFVWAWMKQFQKFLTDVSTPGPYADDAAAKVAGVPQFGQYYQPSGAVVVRLI